MTPKLSYWNKVNPILIQFLSNLSKIILSQKTADIILINADIISFLVASEGKKIQKKWQK